MSPCRCSGSVRCTHQPCLIKWISERGSWACELCYYKYQVIAISTKNPLQVTHTKTERNAEMPLNLEKVGCAALQVLSVELQMDSVCDERPGTPGSRSSLFGASDIQSVISWALRGEGVDGCRLLSLLGLIWMHFSF